MHSMISTAIGRIGSAARHTVGAARRHVVTTGVVGALLTGSMGAGAAFALSSHSVQAASSTAAPEADALAAAAEPGRGHGREAFAFRALVRLVATETNQTAKAVIDQLRAGKSLDQIAGAKAASIRQQVLDRLKVRLDKAVANKRITQAQADQRLAAWKTRLEKLMSTSGTSLPFHRLHPGKPAAPTT